ncbi:hypothetical protein ACTA71_001742 [Dictyostelium dimigraforme]
MSLNGGCSQVCTNSVGSFACSCNEGYQLNTDKKSLERISQFYQLLWILVINIPISSAVGGYGPKTYLNSSNGNLLLALQLVLKVLLHPQMHLLCGKLIGTLVVGFGALSMTNWNSEMN